MTAGKIQDTRDLEIPRHPIEAPCLGATRRRRAGWISAGMVALSATILQGQGLEGVFAPELANNAFVTGILPLPDGRFLVQGGT